MRQPGSHPKAYHPPEAGRSDGPRMQMGEVGTGPCSGKLSQWDLGWMGTGTGTLREQRGGLVQVDIKRGRKTGF